MPHSQLSPLVAPHPPPPQDDVLIDIIQTSITSGNVDMLSTSDRRFEWLTLRSQVEGFLGSDGCKGLEKLINTWTKSLLNKPPSSSSSSSNTNDKAAPKTLDLMGMHVSGLPYSLTLPSLTLWLSKQTTVQIHNPHMPPGNEQGGNRGFAFVDVERNEGVRFRGDVGGEECEGRKVRVKEAKERQPNQGGTGKHPGGDRMTPKEGVRKSKWIPPEGVKEEGKTTATTSQAVAAVKAVAAKFVPPGKRALDASNDDNDGSNRPKKSRWGAASKFIPPPAAGGGELQQNKARLNSTMAKGPDSDGIGFKEGWRKMN